MARNLGHVRSVDTANETKGVSHSTVLQTAEGGLMNSVLDSG